MSSPIDTILTDAAGTIFAAGAGALLFAQFRGLRLFISLRRVAEILRRVRTNTYDKFSEESDISLCDKAKKETEVTIADLVSETEGVFRLSRPLNNEIKSLVADLIKVKDSLVSDIGSNALGYQSFIPSTATSKARDLERRFLRISWRTLAPWSFLWP